MEGYTDYLNKVRRIPTLNELWNEISNDLFYNKINNLKKKIINNGNNLGEIIFLLPLLIARAATEDNEEIVRLFIKAGYIFTQKTDLSPDEIEGFFSESIFVWESMFEAIINNFSDTKLKGILIYFNNSITFEKFPIIRIGLILALMETNTGRIFSLIDLRSEFNITLNDFITILEYQNSWGLNLSPEKVYTGFKFLFSKEDIPKFVDKLKENQNIIPNARIYEKYFNSKREVLARIFK